MRDQHELFHLGASAGIDILRQIKENKYLKRAPVVVLTTRAGAKHVSLARRLGIAHYVTKPVDEEACN